MSVSELYLDNYTRVISRVQLVHYSISSNGILLVENVHYVWVSVLFILAHLRVLNER